MLVVRPHAEADIEKAFDWYEAQQTGLGERFVSQMDVTLSQIQDQPESFPVIYRAIHRALLDSFPYVIYYIVNQDTIEIVGVIHASRHFRVSQRRLDK